jgi:hypothetical protein
MALRRASVTMVPEPIGPVEPPYLRHFESMCSLLERNNRIVTRILRHLEANALRSDVDLDIFVSTIPTVLTRSNRRLTRIWVANAAAVQIDNLHGGFANFYLQAGWNPIDCVEGARIQVQSGPGFSALWQCTDTVTTGATL